MTSMRPALRGAGAEKTATWSEYPFDQTSFVKSKSFTGCGMRSLE